MWALNEHVDGARCTVWVDRKRTPEEARVVRATRWLAKSTADMEAKMPQRRISCRSFGARRDHELRSGSLLRCAA